MNACTFDCDRLTYAYALWSVLVGGGVVVLIIGAILERRR